MLPIVLILSYLIGSISSAIIICRLLNLPDPRTVGSNNPGATNILRIADKKTAGLVLVADGLKGAIPLLIGYYLGFNLAQMAYLALAVFLGHVYPLFFGFKGGKGVATFLGALFVLNYWVALIFALTWLFVAKILKISSLSALIATFLTPVYFYFITDDTTATYAVIIICIWIFSTHQNNIKRLLSGDEGKI